jgi:hypothetical protein
MLPPLSHAFSSLFSSESVAYCLASTSLLLRNSDDLIKDIKLLMLFWSSRCIDVLPRAPTNAANTGWKWGCRYLLRSSVSPSRRGVYARTRLSSRSAVQLLAMAVVFCGPCRLDTHAFHSLVHMDKSLQPSARTKY